VSARGLRRALAGPALALASVAFTAGVVEGVLRLAGYTPERFRNTARVADPRGRMLLDCYPTNPRRYFDLDLRVAEVRERYRWLAPVRLDAVARRAPWAVEFQYNSRRFRDAELVPKRPGVHRVLVVGDSFTEGQGVRETDTYPGRWSACSTTARTGSGRSGTAPAARRTSRPSTSSSRRSCPSSRTCSSTRWC
jgi:hypothetical protein